LTETAENNTAQAGESVDFDTSAFDNLFDGIDLSMILDLMNTLSNPKEDKNVNFLLALKPLLSEERAPKVEKAVRVLKMYDIYTVLKDSGMLSGLSDII
jgi:hypothetical protein